MKGRGEEGKGARGQRRRADESRGEEDGGVALDGMWRTGMAQEWEGPGRWRRPWNGVVRQVLAGGHTRPLGGLSSGTKTAVRREVATRLMKASSTGFTTTLPVGSLRPWKNGIVSKYFWLICLQTKPCSMGVSCCTTSRRRSA